MLIFLNYNEQMFLQSSNYTQTETFVPYVFRFYKESVKFLPLRDSSVAPPCLKEPEADVPFVPASCSFITETLPGLTRL